MHWKEALSKGFLSVVIETYHEAVEWHLHAVGHGRESERPNKLVPPRRHGQDSRLDSDLVHVHPHSPDHGGSAVRSEVCYPAEDFRAGAGDDEEIEITNVLVVIQAVRQFFFVHHPVSTKTGT